MKESESTSQQTEYENRNKRLFRIIVIVLGLLIVVFIGYKLMNPVHTLGTEPTSEESSTEEFSSVDFSLFSRERSVDDETEQEEENHINAVSLKSPPVMKIRPISRTRTTTEKYYLNDDGQDRFSKYEVGYSPMITAGGENKTLVGNIFALGHEYCDTPNVGTPYTPVAWVNDNSATYSLAYCSEPLVHAVESTENEMYYERVDLINGQGYEELSASDVEHLQFIIENSYPFISDSEMAQRINTYLGTNYTFEHKELIAIAQASIWSFCGATSRNQFAAPMRYDTVYDNAINHAQSPAFEAPTTATTSKMNAAISYLCSQTSTLPPLVPIEIIDFTWSTPISNNDGTYSADFHLTFNKEVTSEDNLVITLNDGYSSFQTNITTENCRATVTYPNLHGASFMVTANLSSSNSTSRLRACIYESHGYNGKRDKNGNLLIEESQRLIGAVKTDLKPIIMPLVDRNNKRQLSLSKQWLDNESHTDDSVIVQLYANKIKYGETITLDESNEWTYSYENLPLNDVSGHEIEYSIKEKYIDGYAESTQETDSRVEIQELDGETVRISQSERLITNSPTDKTTFAVKKTWSDINHPSSVTVHLLCNGTEFLSDDGVVTLSDSNNWCYRWENLPKTDKDGNDYIYTAKESPIENYHATYETVTAPDNTNEYFIEQTTAFVDGGKYLLHTSDGDLSAYGMGSNKIKWVNNPLAADNPSELDTLSIWTASANGNGFTLTNEQTDRVLTYNDRTSAGKASRFSVVPSATVSGDYDFKIKSSNKLYAGSNRYFLSMSSNYGTSTTAERSGRSFTFYRLLKGGMTKITNTPYTVSGISLRFNKVDLDENNPLSDVTLALYREDEFGDVVIPNSQFTSDDNTVVLGDIVDTWTTGITGSHSVHDIFPGKYRLVEMGTKANYEKIVDNIRFTVTDDFQVIDVEGLLPMTDDDGNEITLVSNNEITIANRKIPSYVLPKTGSTGTRTIIIVGISLLVLSLCLSGVCVFVKRGKKRGR